MAESCAVLRWSRGGFSACKWSNVSRLLQRLRLFQVSNILCNSNWSLRLRLQVIIFMLSRRNHAISGGKVFELIIHYILNQMHMDVLYLLPVRNNPREQPLLTWIRQKLHDVFKTYLKFYLIDIIQHKYLR